MHLMASFPGLGPSVWHAPDAIDSWHSAAPHSREKVLGFYVALNSGPPPISESTSTVQTTSVWFFEKSLPGVQIPTEPPLLTIQKRLLNGCIWVYTFFLLYYILDLRTFHSISSLSLLLTRDLFRSCPGLLNVVEQGGGIWERGCEP